MYQNVIKLFLLSVLLNLMGCGEKETTSSSDNFTPGVVYDATGQLRLEIPNLLGWGKMPEIKITIGDTIELLVTLENQKGESIPNEHLLIVSDKGNFLSENLLITDHNGQAISFLVATLPGKDQITVNTKEDLSATLPITIIDPETQENEKASSVVLEELPGVISWKVLAKVTLKNEVPFFDKEIEALNGQKVKVQGFMMPLEQTEKHKHFLLSVNPPSCSFCYPAEAEGLIEIYTTKSIEFSYDPILISGTLQVLKNDEMGLYYRMQDALKVTIADE